jgi:D-beta-D-heptose 7-phosphate kinase/D-beta-D-heptose 1-phosphate adenosyltransferase
MPLLSSALQKIDKFTSAKVLVVGDIMLDCFVGGEVSRISPEAPIPVLRTKSDKYMLGGAGNVVANLLGLECQVGLISITGADETAKSLETMLSSQKGTLDLSLIADESRPTSLKTRFMAGHQQLLRVDTESAKDINADIEAKILAAVKEKASHGYKALILSDYGKGMLTNTLAKDIIAFCNEANIQVLVDPKGTDYSKYSGADVVTPNKKELAESVGNLPTDSDEDVLAATKELLKRSGIRAVVATRSADGMSIKSAFDNDEITHLPTIAREVFDVSGAGDTVIATVAAGLAAGADLVMAAAIANAAGGLVVEKVGTAAIRASELRGFLLEDGHRLFKTSAKGGQDMRENLAVTHYNMAPILSWHDAADQVERWKARGLKIGFTNGAFDILHQGHVTYLAKSNALCDKLIVGLNCDASIQRYKSKDRPVNPQDARARVLSALSCVDMVVIFGEKEEENDTPLMLMQALRPDVITKGADYTIETVVGADFVQSYGGEVALIDLEEGFSTTNTIRKMTAA